MSWISANLSWIGHLTLVHLWLAVAALALSGCSISASPSTDSAFVFA